MAPQASAAVASFLIGAGLHFTHMRVTTGSRCRPSTSSCGGAGIRPSALRDFQSGWPSRFAPWQDAQLATIRARALIVSRMIPL